MSWDTVVLIIIALLIKLGTEKVKPIAIPLGNGGDTLMVRIVGYGFCPSYCDANHNHFGHKEGYKCGDAPCYHIIFED